MTAWNLWRQLSQALGTRRGRVGRATILHLPALDHEHRSFYLNGLDRQPTDVHGNVIEDVQT